MGKTAFLQRGPLVDVSSTRFRVSRHAFVDREVLEAEYAEIFDRCWLYVGHTSEIPKAGDFITRTVSRRSVLFVRDKRGEVRAFLNTCPHRGAQVCRARSGNAKSFQCFYHGWVFGPDGRLRSQSDEESYASGFNDQGAGNLVPVPRLASYRDFWFVSFNPDVENLEDYLAGAKDYIDVICDQSSEGMEIVEGCQEYSIRANWKLLTENSIDGYHASTTHATYFDYMKNSVGSLASVSLEGKAFDLGNGHSVLEYSAPWGRPVAQWIPAWGEEGREEIDSIYARLKERLGEERAERIARKNRNLFIFPNLVINDIMAVTVRTFFPHEPDYMQVNGWALAPRDESASARKYRLFNFLEFLGPGGFATPDDVEALEQCQRGYASVHEAPWNDISKGMTKEQPAYDDELQMRAFWRHWHESVRTLVEE